MELIGECQSKYVVIHELFSLNATSNYATADTIRYIQCCISADIHNQQSFSC